MADVITLPYRGVERISGNKRGYPFEIFITDPSKVRYKVVYLDPTRLSTVTSIQRAYNAQIAMAGGEWNDRDASLPSYLKPKDYLVSDGTRYVARTNAGNPSLMIDVNNKIFISQINASNTKQAFTGIFWLIQNGEINPNLYDTTKPQYTEGHARHSEGVTGDGKLMSFNSQGVYANQGLTLLDNAQLMKSYGAVNAFFASGGGDVSCRMGDQNLIIPENIVNGNNVERVLPAVFLIYAEENGGNTMPKRYQATAIGNGTRVRPAHNTNNTYINSYPLGTKFNGDVLWTTNVDVYGVVNGVNTLLNKAGDSWLEATDVNGSPITNTSGAVVASAWVAIVHMGGSICTLVDNGTPPPTTVFPTEVWLSMTENGEKKKYVLTP